MTDQLIDEAAERLDRRTGGATPITTDLRVSFEFFPPATPAGSKTLEASAAALAPFDPTFVSVTYGAGGSSQDKTFAALDQLSAIDGLPVAGHLTCVSACRDTIGGVIDSYREKGLKHIVALRGDAPAEDDDGCVDGVHPNGYCDAVELVEGIRSRADSDEIEISVGAYPEVHPKAISAKADMDNLKRKIDAGADRAITQFFFDADVFLRFLDQTRAAGITAPIVPGIMPVTNFAGICRFSERCGTTVPQWMHDLFDGLDDAPEIRELVAATVAAEQCKRLVEHGVRDFHFYTMNKPNLTAATCRILGITPAPAKNAEAKAS
ncbi:MAG: methylenetetrahydrofolate reductase [NAD(P)H] [Acidimicrobiales bacterium]